MLIFLERTVISQAASPISSPERTWKSLLIVGADIMKKSAKLKMKTGKKSGVENTRCSNWNLDKWSKGTGKQNSNTFRA